MFFYRKHIEYLMRESEANNQDGTGQDKDVTKITRFNSLLIKYRNNIRDCVYSRNEFWRELLNKTPDILKIQNLGSIISNKVSLC